VLSGEHIALSPIVANFGKRCGVWTAEWSVLIDHKDIYKASEPVEYGISVLVMDE
jgi:hypothetical protein